MAMSLWDVIFNYAGGRFSLEEMEGFLEEAKRCIPGTSEVIDQALDHEAHKVRPPLSKSTVLLERHPHVSM